MSNEEQTPPPLLLPKKEYVGETAFDGDQLSRKELGDRLTTYLERLRRGAVIAIDAPWGEGKTWFGKNWEQSLQNDGYKVAFIDAFEQDYIEDSFLLIAAELMNLLDEDQDISGLRGQAVSVMKALVPVTAKAVMNLAGRTIIGTTNLEGDLKSVSEELLSGATDLSAQWINVRLNDYQHEKESFSAFRETISQLATGSDKPIVIIVDELDRCKPSFAVSLIERLKHFFDVPNLVFIRLMNKKQLESAVSGVYGEGTDSHAYLGKFINLTLSLPKKRKLDYPGEDHIKQYCSHIFAQYEFGNQDHHSGFLNTFSLMANVVNLSLRDIEKGISWYAFTYPNKAATWLLSEVTPNFRTAT